MKEKNVFMGQRQYKYVFALSSFNRLALIDFNCLYDITMLPFEWKFKLKFNENDISKIN